MEKHPAPSTGGKAPAPQPVAKPTPSHLALLRAAAERLKSRLPATVDVDDLISEGWFGLREALAHFDPGRGVKFETFAIRRIRGAMLDYLRSIDWSPRTVRQRQRLLEQARQRFHARHGRPPSTDELKRCLPMPEAETTRVMRDGQVTGLVSLDQPLPGTDQHGEPRSRSALIADVRTVCPVRAAHRTSLKELIVKHLSRCERLIVLLYYYEGMTMKEIGLTLDLSESRVSQMHSLILQQLKARLGQRAAELATAVD